MKQLFIVLTVCTVFGCLSLARASQDAQTLVTSTTTTFDQGVEGSLQRIAAGHRGIMGIYCRNLENGETLSVNADELFPTASTIKLPVMCAALDLLASGKGPFKSYYDTMKYDAATSTGGSGFIQNFKDGTRIELKELVHLMITVSDNIATNMICEWIGLETVNSWLADRNFKHTRIFSSVGGKQVFNAEGRQTWGLGVTTPREMGTVMEMVATGKAGTTSTTEEMMRILGHQYFDGGIPGAVPPTTYVGSKGGSLNRSRSDVAIVASPNGRYILSIYTKDNEDTSWGKTNEAEMAIRKISNLIWKHYNPQSEWEMPSDTDQF